MLKNYFLIAWRNLLRRKFYSAINIFGLATGITFSLLMGVFILQEFQVNKSLKDADRLYILESRWKDESMGYPLIVPGPAAKELKEQYPTLVENYYRFWDRSVTVTRGDHIFREQTLIGDSTLVGMFGFPVLYGDANSALEDPYSIIITKKIAIKYFGREDVAGQTLTLTTEADGKKDFVIQSVLNDLARNSVSNLANMDGQIFLPLKAAVHFNLPDEDQWSGGDIVSYIKLTPGADRVDAQNALDDLLDRNIQDGLKGRLLQIAMHPVASYYLDTNKGTVKKLLFTLYFILGFILLMVVINFVNITVGNGTSRMKEIGIRKVIGGIRKQLILQFLAESLVLTFAAALISLIFYQLLSPYFGEILNTTLLEVSGFQNAIWLSLTGLVVLLALAAGAYPAFVLSSLGSIESLKGKLTVNTSRALVPKVLLGVQFIFAIVVLISAGVISRQVSYFSEKDLGYDKTSILTVSSVPRIWSQEGLQRMESAKQEFMTLSQVSSVSLSWEILNGNYGAFATIYKDGHSPDESVSMARLTADEHYGQTYRLQMEDGIFFANEGETIDSTKLVINVAAQKALDVEVGDKVRFARGGDPLTIAGIVKDFNYTSLHKDIQPMVFMHTKMAGVFRHLSFKLNPGNIVESVEAVQQKWKQVFPDAPFDYAFMDKKLEELYRSELQLKKASGVATFLIIVIAVLGILGMVALQVARRTKEIGIRKVLGATVSSILLLLSKDYVRIMLISIFMAIPITYYLAQQWLSAFAYRITLEWWMFVLPGCFVLVISLLAVTIQSLKTTLSNPTASLRSE